MNRALPAMVALAFAGCTTSPSPTGRLVPTAFDHDRIFVVAPADDGGAPLRFYTDSGGGPDAIRRSTAERLGLASIGAVARAGIDAPAMPLVVFPESAVRAGIPRPQDDPMFKGGLGSIDDVRFPFEGDGFLGHLWLRGRVWEIDYPRRTLRHLDRARVPEASHRAALGFQVDGHGARTTDFASLPITVDDETFHVLLDTGANAGLTDSAADVLDVPRGTRIAASFITKSVFDRWTARHPDWRSLPDADAVGGRKMPMIEVPSVTVAGLATGPVWFAMRPDEAFHEYMASMMDRPTEGAIGGSVLRYFRVTIDYPAAVASFELPTADR